MSLSACAADSGKRRHLTDETDDAWLDPPPAPRFLDEERFLWRSRAAGDSTRWAVLEIGDDDGRPGGRTTVGTRFLTPPGIDAGDLIDVHAPTGEALFEGWPHGGNATGVFRSRAGDDSWSRPRFGPEATGSARVELDEAKRLALVTTSSSTTPPRLEVRRVADGSVVRVLGDGKSPEFDSLRIAVPEFGRIETADGPILWRLWKPADLDPARKHPLILRVYGGPGSRLVQDSWGRGPLLETLLTQRGFVVLEVDGRGSGGRGARFERLVKGRLGLLELEDQVRGVEMLEQRPYVDASRVGIWGWSYGGTMVVNALCRRSDVFRAGVAVAPVTDWRLYDTIYTERYMGRPSDNAAGYDEASCVKHASGMDGRLLLIHGTGDDNVHVQNTLQMVEALVKAGKGGFETMLYPDAGHGMGGNHLDLFTRLVDFFERHLR
jgi:dipeptidyl-peptidase-4